MNYLNKSVIRLFDLVAGLALSFMMAVVSAQVITRTLSNITNGAIDLMFSGAIELASYSLLIAVFASFPRAMSSGLVNVDLFTAKFPLWVNDLLDRIWALLTALVALGMSYKAFVRMGKALDRNLLTQDLDMPMAVFFGYVSIATLAFFLTGLVVAFRRSQPNY